MDVRVEYPMLGTAVVRPRGRIDALSAHVLRETLRKLPARGALQIVVDLDKVPFMDSSGLSTLVSGLRAVREKNGVLVLARPNEQVRRALQLSLLARRA